MVPLLGNLVGSVAEVISGVAMGSYLNRHLQPYVLDLALDITGLAQDDLFYYKNKPTIDGFADAFQTNSADLRFQLEPPWHPRG